MDPMTHRLDPLGMLFEKSWAHYKRHLGVSLQILIIPIVLYAMVRASGNPLFVFLGALIFGFGTLAVIVAITKNKGVGESYKEGAVLFLPILWVGILSLLAVLGGFVMLIIPGLMMIAWFVFSNYIVVLEGKRGLKVLAQGKEYARGYWWAIFGRYFLIGLITGFSAVILSGIGYLVGGLYVSVIVYSAALLFIAPFTVSYGYLIYENIRAIKGDVAPAAAAHHGFLLASILVGIAAPIVILIGFILGAVVGMKRDSMHNFVVPTAQSQNIPPPVSGAGTGAAFPQY